MYIPEPKKRAIIRRTIRMKSSAFEKLDDMAALLNTSSAKVLEELVDTYLSAYADWKASQLHAIGQSSDSELHETVQLSPGVTA